MKISGFIKNSLLDYPSCISSVIFTQSCNMRCGFCHNADLISYNSSSKKYFSQEYILSYLKQASSFVDALVITGGEACMQKDLLEFMYKVKSLGLKIKLDTNGTKPLLLTQFIDEGVLDYIAMDIKAPLDICSYRKLVGDRFSESDLDCVKDSIDLVIKSNINYEFRSTLIRELHSYSDLDLMFAAASGADKYVLQTFKSKETLLDKFKLFNPFVVDEAYCIKSSKENYIKTLEFI